MAIFIRIKNPETGQTFLPGKIKLSAVIKTLKNAGDAGAEQKVLADCKPINTPVVKALRKSAWETPGRLADDHLQFNKSPRIRGN